MLYVIPLFRFELRPAKRLIMIPLCDTTRTSPRCRILKWAFNGVESEDGNFVKGVIIVMTLKAIYVSLNVRLASGARREYSDFTDGGKVRAPLRIVSFFCPAVPGLTASM